MFVRYEDLARNQTKYIEGITKFTETEISHETIESIIHHSTSNSTHKEGFYTTSRNKDEG